MNDRNKQGQNEVKKIKSTSNIPSALFDDPKGENSRGITGAAGPTVTTYIINEAPTMASNIKYNK